MDRKERTGISSRLANALDWWERARSLLEQIGLRNVIASSLSVGALATLTWFRDNVPWYLAGLMGLLALAIVSFVIHRVQIIRATSKFNARDYQKFGHELVTLSQEIFRFLADRQRDQMDVHKANPRANGIPSIDFWQADRDFERVTGRLFFEKFGPRVLGSLALLQRIGISMPVHMISSAEYRPNGLPQFLGTMGDLLSRGNIADAVAISNDQDFMWQIQH